MADIDKLRDDWQTAEAKAVELQNEKDEALAKVREKYGDRLRKAVDDAAAKQKVYLDAEAAQALADRDIPDGEKQEIANRLGLTLP